MFSLNYFACFVIVLIQLVSSQLFVGDLCSLKSSGSPGVCKLFKECKQARDDLRKHQIFPQRCGFQRDESIVCCVKSKRKPGEISLKKCKEYSRLVYEVTRPPILLVNRPPITRNECGHRVIRLIVGGTNVTRKEFPHMALIGFEPQSRDIKWLCGGTIISNEYILTAAHCLSHHEHGRAKYVRIGVTNLEDTNHRQQLEVEEIIPHPEYRSSSHYHDIGLLRLKRSAKLNSFTVPACLYSNHDIESEKAIATGWGSTTYEGSGTNNLLKVTLDLWDHALCNQSYKNEVILMRRLKKGIIDDIQVCAGSLDNDEKDTCQGDSGGPLQIFHKGNDIKCMYDIIGVTSFGKSCGVKNPGVYVRVSKYIGWIEDIVWPENA
ncbi:serine protease snake-like [Tenebrio molitor]|uniref:serine protease snake-like n=1 Tax=Tenebrio molitor TaxID=7067 RepID=UPI0036247CDD